MILDGEASTNLTCSVLSRLRLLAEFTSHSALPEIRFDVGGSRMPASPRCTCQTQSRPVRPVFLGCGVIGPYDTEIHVLPGRRRLLSQGHISHENVPNLMVAHLEGRYVIRQQPIPLVNNSQAQLIRDEYELSLDMCEYFIRVRDVGAVNLGGSRDDSLAQEQNHATLTWKILTDPLPHNLISLARTCSCVRREPIAIALPD